MNARKEVMNDRVHFVWTHFSELTSYFQEDKQMDAWVRCLYSALPTNNHALICTGHGRYRNSA
ncbi:hypothetical protein NC652_004916 [Populus alba x Populus x berolinensis]|nr:hypothetical protein NC652_004916 [Populus alba x Populus x berolinensis]